MAREEFIQNLRHTLSLAAPSVEADTAHLNAAERARMIFSADEWLKPESVEGFSVDDFAGLDASSRKRLVAAAKGFAAMAAAVNGAADGAANQAQDAWDKLQEIIEIIRPSVQAEWSAQVESLVNQAADWCQQREWIAKTKKKHLKDKLIGEYDLPQLHFYDGENHLLLDPIARFAPGTSGLVDLALLPVFDSMMVARIGGDWYIRPDYGQGRRRKWSEASFVDAVQR
ncbi:MAG: hypothetical protein B7Z73_01190, partial [Planctomycetia bacterium 21-64-5]